MFRLAIFIISLSCTVAYGYNVGYAPIIQIDSGLVRGIRSRLINSNIVHVYQGIRYGEAKRFEKSKFAQHWNGIYDAIEKRDSCPQPGKQLRNNSDHNSVMESTTTMSEDCLYLSVYRPELMPEKNQLPVMVWIHGGAFISGSIFDDIYNPSYMVIMGDVIVVTINYRLGPFGFLFDGTDNAPGNQGLYDQILALKWVKNNIGNFGGDPKRVTIFGESAGSMSISALILSPLTEGLFIRAILQSGATNAYLGSCDKNIALNKTISFAQRLSCESSENQTQIIECLRSKSVEEILSASKNDLYNGQLMIPVYGDELMPISPVEALANGKFNNHIDIMFGVNRNEGSSFIKQVIPFVITNHDHPNITLSMVRTGIWLMMMMFEKSDPIAQQVVEFYMKNLNEKSNADDMRIILADVFGDYHLVCPTILFGEYLSRSLMANRRSFYSYRLMLPIHNGTYNCNNDWQGVCHGEDVVYLFHVPMSHRSYTKDEIQLSNDMIISWTTFAWTGHPTTALKNDDNQTAVKWTEAINNRSEYVSFMSLQPKHYEMISNYFHVKCDQFWKPILFEHKKQE